MFKNLNDKIKSNLHRMVEDALETNKGAVLDEYLRQIDNVIAEAEEKIEQQHLEQDQIGQFLKRKRKLEDLMSLDPDNQKVKETLEQVNRFLAENSRS